MYEQISTVRSQIQTTSSFFCNSNVKQIPNAIPLARIFNGIYMGNGLSLG